MESYYLSEFEMTSANHNFLQPTLPGNISLADMEYLQHKCEAATPILKNNWEVLLPKCTDFVTLVDKKKVSFDIGIRDLNNILISGFFTSEEERLIKKLRYQGRNNLAAKTMREKYRMKDEQSESEIEDLRQERDNLIHEKEQLISSIVSYRNAIKEQSSKN